MTSIRTLTTLTALLALTPACKKKHDDGGAPAGAPSAPAAPATPAAAPVAMTWSELATMPDTDFHATEHSGKTIVIEGYLKLPFVMYTSKDRTRLDLFPRPHQISGDHLSLSTTTGTGPHQGEALPEKYSNADFKIHTDAGEVVGVGAYVRATVALDRKDADGTTGSLVKLEKLEAKPYDYGAAAPFAFDQAATLENKLVKATGLLTAPTMVVKNNDGEYLFDLGAPAVPEGKHVNVALPVGAGPSEMAELPDNFGPGDLKLTDASGAPLPLDKPVVIYGQLYKPTPDADWYLAAEKLEPAAPAAPAGK